LKGEEKTTKEKRGMNRKILARDIERRRKTTKEKR
jgi:hypothetical protein